MFSHVEEEVLAQSSKYHLEIKQSLQMAFKLLNCQLKHQSFDSLLSGSTLTVILIYKEFIYTANVGDSTALLMKMKKGHSSFEGEPFQLSVDHKPHDFSERQRIERQRGEVKQVVNSRDGKASGVYRVWLKDKDFPGLAMSRSIGDKLAHTVGVISVPGRINTFLIILYRCDDLQAKPRGL